MTLRAPNGSSSAGLLSRSPLHRSSISQTTLTTTQTLMDGLATNFVEQATDWRSLAAMMAGGLFYRLGRVGTMALPVRAFGQTPLRILSYGVGLGSEVTAFVASHRGLQFLTGDRSNPNLLHWGGRGGFWEGWRSSFVTFAALKSFGRLGAEQSIVTQHFLQDAGMVAGHQLTSRLGLTPTPEGELLHQLIHAEATNLQLGAGMALGHWLMPGLRRMKLGLDLAIQGRQNVPPSHRPAFEILYNPVPPGRVNADLIPTGAFCMAGFGEGLRGILSPEIILGATTMAAMVFTRSSTRKNLVTPSSATVLEVHNGPLGRFTRRTTHGVNIYSPISPHPSTRGLMILISGARGNHTTFGELPRQLAESGFNVQILTIPGFDFDDPPSRLQEVSAKATEAQWHHALSRTVGEILTSYGEGPVHLGGFSLGGAAAIRIFSELPTEQRLRIESMVLAAPALVFRQLNENSPALNWFNRHVVLPILSTLNISSRYLGPITGDPTLDPHLHYFRDATRRSDHAAVLFGEAARSSLECLVEVENLPRTLLLHDPEDPRIYPTATELLREAFLAHPDRLRPVTLRGTDHLIYLFSERERAFKAVREFLGIIRT